MINLPVVIVPEQHKALLEELSKKSNAYYTGYVRLLTTPDLEEYMIDTRFDDELKEAGLLSEGIGG